MTTGAATEVSTRVLTVPNALSAVRLLLVPVFLAFLVNGEDLLALATLVVSSVTDFLDGVIARRFHQVTRLGQLLDPAADRLYIVATLVGLAVREILPWWIVAVVLARDAMLVVLGIVLARAGHGPLAVHRLGKIATFALFWALPVVMLGQAFPALAPFSDPPGWALAAWGAFLYWWAGIVYARETRRIVRSGRVDSARESDTLKR